MAHAQHEPLRIDVENFGPTGGFFLTPVWYGLHDGSFDLFNVGEAASSALEMIAEDGIIDDSDPGVTDDLFSVFEGANRVQGAVTPRSY